MESSTPEPGTKENAGTIAILGGGPSGLVGLSIFAQAKSTEIPYSEVRRKAERLWPLWAR